MLCLLNFRFFYSVLFLSRILSYIYYSSYIFSYSFSNFFLHCMVFRSCCCSLFLSFVPRHFSWFCIMTFSITLVVFIILLLGLLPSLSSATLRSWFCGTCTVCQVCPSCTPQINVSPHCECHETLNNCNCRCLTQQNLHDYYLQWSSHLGATYNNTFATQQNNYLFKRRLLFWLIGLTFFNLFLLFLLGTFVFFAPGLFDRWTRWKSQSRVKRRTRLMHKLNLVERPVSSIELSPSHRLSSLPATFENHAQFMANLTTELPSVHVPLSSSTVPKESRIT
jgi:hypothetical protein